MLCCGGGLALASPASAGTFEADHASVLNGINVTIDTPTFENVQSGMIQLTGPNGLADVWCLDIFDGIHLPYTYTVSQYNALDSFVPAWQYSTPPKFSRLPR